MTIERLRRAAAAVYDQEIRLYLASAVRQIEAGTEPGRALGFGTGARGYRNALTRRAAARLSGSLWDRAEQLSLRLKLLGRIQRDDPVSALLRQADAALRCPRTSRGIYNLLTENIPEVFSPAREDDDNIINEPAHIS